MSKNNEVWKPIKGFPHHEISNYGRVRRLAYSEDILTKNGIVRRNFSQRIKKATWHKESKIFKVDAKNEHGKRTTIFPHRLVAEYFVPNDDPETETEVIHKDFDSRNNHYSNLEWVTASEKMRRLFQAGIRNQKKMWATRKDRYENGFKPGTKIFGRGYSK